MVTQNKLLDYGENSGNYYVYDAGLIKKYLLDLHLHEKKMI